MAQKNKKKTLTEKPEEPTIKNLGIDFSNDPYFVKKADKAMQNFQKNGFPIDLISKDK